MKKSLGHLNIPFIFFLSFFIILTSNVLYSQQIVQVGAGEYFTSYRTDDGSLYSIKWGTDNIPAVYNVGLTQVIDVDGAQYTNVALKSDGSVYIVGVSGSVNPYYSLVATDNLGNAFKGNSKVYGFYQCYLTLRDGNVWYWGNGDVLNINGGANITAPVQLKQPAGKTMVKLVPASATTFGALTFLWGLASDGTVWQWDRTHATPFQVNFSGNIAQDITMIGPLAFVIKTSTDLLTWGYYPSYSGGLPSWQQSGIQSVKAAWQNAGCVFPVKEIVGNYNTLHIIDANDNMFASGSNPQGEIGNGIEYPTWSTSTPNPWQWDFGNGEILTIPVQIPGKFKNINTSNTIAFYLYAQDMGNNWYSWGRNKALCLGNGLTLSINDYAIYPEALNVPAPTLVKPLTQTWKVINFNPNGSQSVLANAGVNQYIGSSSTTLYGSGSSQQNGTIQTYAWIKISGNGGTLVSPASMNTQVNGLVGGTYVFQLTVTNNFGIKATSNVTVVVGSSTDISPIANAGNDTTLLLPKNSIVLNGKGTDQDGSIKSYQWAKIGGPNAGTLTNGTLATATFTNMVKGIYIFELTVSDNAGATGKDAIQVTVDSLSGNLHPAVNPANTINGLDYKYYEGTWNVLPSFTTLIPVRTGAVSNFSLTPALRSSNYGFSFTGFVSVPLDGQYTFYTSSDDGSSLYIDNVLTVSNNGLHGIKEKSGIIGLKAGKHTINCLFFQKGGGKYLRVSYESSNISKQPIPASALYRTNVLLSAVNPANAVQGLDYKYYEGSWNVIPAFSSLSPIKTGTAANFDLSLANKSTQFGFNFTGFIFVPLDGQYTFYTSSDDGSQLYIDNVLTVSNDGLHSAIEKSGIIGLKAGKHAITGLFFQQGGAKVFLVSYAGTGILKQTIPASALFRINAANVTSAVLRGNNQAEAAAAISNSQVLTSNIESLYPNPFNDSFTVQINDITPGIYTLVLTDIWGKRILKKIVNKSTGTLLQTIHVNHISKGTYLLQIIRPDGSKSTQKLIKG